VRFPEDYIGKVLHGDCLEIMNNMPDGCVDLVLTDPPYGIGESNEKNRARGNKAVATDYGSYSWDERRIEPEYIREVIRASRNQIIFGGNYYSDLLPASPCWITWDKRTADIGINDFADGELAWTSFKKSSRIVRYMWNGMWQGNMKDKEKRVHPTQKPSFVMEWILARFSVGNDIVFDPFCGSGTTLVAAKMLGRRFIGIDIEERYVKIAEERLRNTTPPLPFTTEKMEQGCLP